MIGGFPALGDGVQPTPRFAYEAYRDALTRGDAPASPPFTDRPAFIALHQHHTSRSLEVGATGAVITLGRPAASTSASTSPLVRCRAWLYAT